MEFIETPTFTRLIKELMPDEQYHKLQIAMMDEPALGAIIKGGGGIRNATLCFTQYRQKWRC